MTQDAADARPDAEGVEARLAQAIGPAAVSTDPARLELLSRDIYRAGGLARAAVRPASVADLQAAVRVCAAHGVAMVPRGGGASYTDGYLLRGGGHVLFDLGALQAIEIDERNHVVTVEAGVTWSALRERLAPSGLRTPFFGPFSGLVATVGGSVSQHAVSHGSGSHGLSAQSVLGMEVVLASGELMDTTASRGSRHHGPDLTGLFTGDCGALGIKARIRLPLRAARRDFQALSFAFGSFVALHEGLRAAAAEGLDDEHFALDAALSQGQIGKQQGLAALARIAAEVWRAAPGALAAVQQLAAMALAGQSVLAGGAFLAHFIVEGASAAEARAKAAALRRLLATGGRPIANSVPAFVRALPFAPLANIFGPRGERWVPVHGVLAHSAVAAFHRDFEALRGRHQEAMQRLGVWTGAMFTAIGSSALLYELAIYWPDASTPLHAELVDAATRSALPQHPSAPQAAALADAFKLQTVALLDAHGAGFLQVGRAYPYVERLDPSARALLRVLKSTLDPQGLMNPGVLGLGADAGGARPGPLPGAPINAPRSAGARAAC